MPNYREKITEPLANKDFIEGMTTGHFVRSPDHEALTAFIAYTGVRISEALRITRQQFRFSEEYLFVDIGPRLKHSKATAPLKIPLSSPYVEAISKTVMNRKMKERIWPYSRRTGHRIIKRAGFHYPHFLRLSRITNFLLAGYTIPHICSWTGQSATTVNAYVGIVNIEKMGEGLKFEQKA